MPLKLKEIFHFVGMQSSMMTYLLLKMLNLMSFKDNPLVTAEPPSCFYAGAL